MARARARRGALRIRAKLRIARGEPDATGLLERYGRERGDVARALDGMENFFARVGLEAAAARVAAAAKGLGFRPGPR